MKIAIKNTSHIGKAIKLTRLGQGLDQLAAAGLAGTGQSFLSHLENGKDTSQIGKVLEVLTSLGIRVELTLPDDAMDYIDAHLPVGSEVHQYQIHQVKTPIAGQWDATATPLTPFLRKSKSDSAMPALDAETLFKQIASLNIKRATR